MGNATAVKGMELAAQAMSAKAQGSQKAGKTEDGFQKLLNSKSEEDASGTRQTSDTKKEDSREVAKESRPEKDKVEDKAEQGKEAEETEIPVDSALEQVQAALLFQICPEASAEVVEEETADSVLAIGELPAEEIVETAVEVHQPQTEAEKLVIPETEVDLSDKAAVEVEQKQAVMPAEAKEEKPKTQTSLEKPKEQAAKEAPVVSAKPEQTGEQVQAVQTSQVQHTEEAPVRTEVPTQYVRVQEPEEVPEKILDQILVKTSEGIKEFEVQLEPYDLGKIMIRVAFGKEAATVSIVCTEPKTMELMAKNARELGAIMEENLGSPTTIVVEDKEASYLEQRNQENSQNQGQNPEQDSEKQNQKSRQDEGADFLQQLRLGLI